jgi:hypothetical protein
VTLPKVVDFQLGTATEDHVADFCRMILAYIQLRGSRLPLL